MRPPLLLRSITALLWTTTAAVVVVVVAVQVEPLWINSTNDAIASGVNLDAVWRLHCPKVAVGQEIAFLDFSMIEQLYGIEKVEQLLMQYSYIALNLVSLCKGVQPVREETPLEVSLDEPESRTLPPFGEISLDSAPISLDPAPPASNPEILRVNTDDLAEEKSVEPSTTTEKPQKKAKAEFHGPIGIDLSNVDAVKLAKLEKTLENDKALENILRRLEFMAHASLKPIASTFLLPLMRRVKYDPRSPPSVLENQVINVFVGIHVQSISNFELTTMDYDMDMWLRMAWRDPRLAHGLAAPVLVSEETFLKRLWRPDPFFSNSKISLFHRVTFLNFYMYIFPGGEMFFEARLYLKPKCVLTLCNYPHDSQVCKLHFSSIAFTTDVVQFHWFPRRYDAIRFNQNVQLPELYISNFSHTTCDGRRKSGNFTCLEARFNMKRNLGYHMAQTYVPTATCVFFSWISVWLPEEFVEGRVFVALTVFLTLSAESNAAKETLPKVSYIKAIDIWFGFTATFVFSTMVQALVVIGFEHRSKVTRRKLEERAESLTVYEAARLAAKSAKYHRIGRGLDTFFKVGYPLIFVVFLIVYRFIIIEGEENKCIRNDYRHTEL